MRDDERLHDVIRMLYEYSARPPLKFPSKQKSQRLPAKSSMLLMAQNRSEPNGTRIVKKLSAARWMSGCLWTISWTH